ncbi:MAG: type II toxin-antitoxin system RelB/DinJ family antitoxin [Clostridia bacterium]|nr:type II toxin-antitoxin system RelB/DinJ family antitoxin [Clostridia bacterium]
METRTVNFKMDSKLKAEADELFAELGMNMTTAINVFIRQAVRQRKIPFEVAADMPNAETIAAMKEADRIARDPNAKRYSSFKDLLSEVEADEA